MDHTEKQRINLPVRALQDRYADFDRRVLRHQAGSISEVYAKSVARRQDYLIREQAIKTLPRSLTELISIALRDEGNALIEETRQINNRYVGLGIRKVQALLDTDFEINDLKARLLDWAERVIGAVLFKIRRQLDKEPIPVYLRLYRSFIHEIDTTIAHGDDHMFSLAWTPVMEALPYWLIDAIFVKPGLVAGGHANSIEHTFSLGGTLRADSAGIHVVAQHLNLYAYEPIVYVREVVLGPLYRAVMADGTQPSAEAMRCRIDSWLADLLEAFPYLLSSTRVGKHISCVAGSTCVVAFDFTANDGFGRFIFSDSQERLARDIELGMSRGILEVGFDGRIAFYLHPWMTLERVFGTEKSLVMTYWLLKLAHDQVVADYLKIKDYFLDPRLPSATADTEEESDENAFASYGDWVREAQEVAPDAAVAVNDPRETCPISQIPQMRRTRLFKLLSGCSVSIEQGKGSEIKLLRAGFHPFRLGNHYGPNPTVPSFMIANILKRLQITRVEWRQAIANLAVQAE